MDYLSRSLFVVRCRAVRITTVNSGLRMHDSETRDTPPYTVAWDPSAFTLL